jgi:hypothetical protein
MRRPGPLKHPRTADRYNERQHDQDSRHLIVQVSDNKLLQLRPQPQENEKEQSMYLFAIQICGHEHNFLGEIALRTYG